MKISTGIGKRFSLLFIGMALISFTMQAGSIQLNGNENEIRILQNTELGFTAGFTFSDFKTLEVKTPEGIFTRIMVPAYADFGLYGDPELPVKSELIAIPAGATVRIDITDQTYREFLLSDLGINYPVMPHQPPVPKTGEMPAFRYNQSTYQSNQFLQQELVSVENLGVMRGTSVGRLDIMPVQYNPASGTVRIYENITFEVIFENADLALTEKNRLTYGNHYFTSAFASFLNYREASASRENLTQYPIKYVIVSDPIFEDALQPFIEWKTKMGFTVIQAYTNDPNVGTTTSQIKAYLEALYLSGTPEDPAPTFALFVGDIAQVPAFTGQAASHVTDLYYCEYTGDYFPEMFYGRFSATNVAQVQPQVEKTLMYEQYTMPFTQYLDTVVMIAGMDGTFGPTHGNGQINYGTENYFNAAHGLYSHTYLYPESGSNSAQIRQNISDGVTFANYTAHGSPDGWADPGFTVGHIPSLQNDGKYGLLVGNCCSTSEYQVGECFGEALLRAANKGAVGYIGASNSTYWDEDYYFGVGVGAIAGDPPSYEETSLGYYDRAFHDHGEPFEEWYTAAGPMIFAGNLAVTEGAPGSAEYYWEAYCLMGDPSLTVYFGEPPAMNAVYDPLLPLGSATFTVTAVPYAYVGVSLNGILLGAALADQFGVATVELEGASEPGNADVVITAQNFQPYMGNVLIASPDGPYVMLNSFLADDSEGNFNGLAESGETIRLSAELKNWGNGDSYNTGATLLSTDSYVEIVDDYQDYGLIPSQDSLMQDNAFQFVVADSVPDMYQVPFTLEIQGENRETWSSSLFITLYAPVMQIGAMTIDDSQGGNGNSRLDPGETVNILVNCHNNGHCDAYGILATMWSTSPLITVTASEYSFDTLNWNGVSQAVFTATLAGQIDPGTLIDLHMTQSADPYTDSKLFNVPVGLVIEDFESGDFSKFEWVMQGNQPWQITGENVFEGQFSVRSGAIDHEQTSEFMIEMEVAVADSISFFRKVSCEDDPYNDNYDWLGFYIDEVQIARWDGELGWGRVAFPVSAGVHTFKWVYNKDYSVAAGMDAAWIDNIIFPAVAPVVGIGDSKGNDAAGMNILPNPASADARMQINLVKASVVSVTIYDLAGNLISEVLPAEYLPAGQHIVEIEIGNMASGVYFCRLVSGDQILTKKLIIKN